jgi:digeranylgeranylglycerophospholipid reductase
MYSTYSRTPTDCAVVGASFAGLSCARALAQRGFDVTILEKKGDPGEKLHTTGILVKEAAEQNEILNGLPGELVRRIEGVRLYSPNLRHVDLSAPGYYFLATDTPNLMRWLAERARKEGVRIALKQPFAGARRTSDGFDLNGTGRISHARFLVGADGPNSRVAQALGLGLNQRFLFGIEHEYALREIAAPERLHCFIDKHIAPSYIGWVVRGVHHIQVGLARRTSDKRLTLNAAMEAFLAKIARHFDFRSEQPLSVRAGLIPCGGLVAGVATERALLVGDAAGMVSPVTAGGIHTALKHGWAAGQAIGDCLSGERDDPSKWFVQSYPRFRAKRVLRFLFDHFQNDLAFDLLLATPPMRAAASMIYFHRKGVFSEPEGKNDRPPLL